MNHGCRMDSRSAPVCALLLLAVAWTLAPSEARADNIDQALIKKAPEIFEYLQKQGYRNVGVFKFQAKKGKNDPTFNAGAINQSLATRLENALILANDLDKPIGIIRNATAQAVMQAPKATYLSPEGRESLFQLSYSLAWGSQKVTADAFLSGTVEFSSNLRDTTINLTVFDRKAAKLQDLLSVKASTDRSILADSGFAYALAKRSLTKRGVSGELEEEAAACALFLVEPPTPPTVVTPPSPATPRDAFDLVRLEVFAESTPLTVSRGSTSPGEYQMTDPREGQKVEFKLTNLTAEKLGVVLKVNGQSTLDYEEGEDDRCLRWVLEPNGSYRIRGFHNVANKTVDLFKVASDAESRSAWGNFKRPGFIDVAVYRESTTPIDEGVKYSLRGLSRRSLGKMDPPETLQALKEQLRKGLASKMTAMGLLVPGAKESSALETSQLNNPQLAGNAHILYYQLPAAP